MTAPDTLARASTAARLGDYATAEQALAAAGGLDSQDPAVLDLLARVHAQRGDLIAADACWARALAIDPAFAPATAGRRRIAAEITAATKRHPGRLAAVLVALVLAGAAGHVTADRAPAPQDTALNQIRDEQRAQTHRVADLERAVEEEAHNRPLDDAATALAGVPALTLTPTPATLTITFPEAVFSRFTTLAPTGAATIAGTAAALAPLTDRVAITVIGHTEDARVSPSSGYRTNAELGLARAATAAEHMAQAANLPLTTFTLATAGDTSPPFPNTTEEGRARNRTITLSIHAR
ncbi:OmpA family protein [Actinokineospora sp. G85]|uniref:OmpA family protein n=1 Tax=Actinokineospora sp. G85 TaxID=3406626 RepID=UPI003C711037